MFRIFVWAERNEGNRIADGLVWLYAKRYSTWSRFLHRFNYHHVKPMPLRDGAVWCHWCGLRGTDYTKARPDQSQSTKQESR